MDQTYDSSLLAWIIVGTFVSTLVLGLRFWAAYSTKRRAYADDFLILFAWMNTTVLEGTTIWAVFDGGDGQPIADLTQKQIGITFKVFMSAAVCWLLGTVFIKFTILWLYTRIFTSARFRPWAYVGLSLASAYFIAFFIMFMTNCIPPSQQWAPVPWGHCRNVKVEEISSVTLNIAVDLYIVILPMPSLWRLKLSRPRKAAIATMFGLGLLTIGIMIWRLQDTIAIENDPDFTATYPKVNLISFLELWVGIIVANVPMMAPLLKLYIIPAFTRLSGGSSSKNNHIGLQLAKNTIGGGGGSSGPGDKRPPRNPYSRFDDDQTIRNDEDGSTVKLAAMTTECAHEPAVELSSLDDDRIHVQHDIETTDIWRTKPNK